MPGNVYQITLIVKFATKYAALHNSNKEDASLRCWMTENAICPFTTVRFLWSSGEMMYM